MEDLHNLTQAGCNFYDLNWEFINKTDWSWTPLGPLKAWSNSLQSYVNIVTTLPHPAAVFWQHGQSNTLSTIHNLSFGKYACTSDCQGKPAKDCLSEDGLKSLRCCLRGRTVKVDCAGFLSDAPKIASNSPALLSPLLNDSGEKCGVLLQILPRQEGSAQGGDAVVNEVVEEDNDDEGGEDLQQLDKGEDKDSSINLKENKLFQKFTQMLPTGLAILNSDAEALFVNREFYSLTSNRNHDLGNFRCWPESIHPEDFDRVMDAYRKAFKSTEPLRVEFRCAEGEDDPWRLFMMRSLTEQPDKGGFICAVIDVSEIKAAELAQRKAASEAKERKEQQERFIDMISHEIRNPLSAVLHSAEEIKEVVARSKGNGGNDQEAADIIDAIDTILLCVAHQSTLVDDILSFSKLDAMMLSLNPQKTQPKISFSEALKLFQPELRAKKINFEYVLDVSFKDNSIDWVLADMKRIKQVLVNLMTNAIKFTAKAESEKKIMVAVGVARERPTSYPPNVVFFNSDESYRMDSTLTSEWGNKQTIYLMVAIKDTGIGISAEDQKKLFERFRQATPKTQEKYGGSGLGLFISRKLCQLHGGDIGVSSKEGSGSTFGFFFKVRRSEPPSDEEKEEVPDEVSSLSVQASEMISNSKSGESSIIDANGAVKEGVSPEVDEMATQLRRRNLVHVVAQDRDDDMECLKNPDTRLVTEAHPASQDGDERYETTNEIASDVGSHAKDDEQKKGESSGDLDYRDDKTSGSDEPSRKSSMSKKDHKAHDSCSILLVEDNQINQKVLARQLRSRGFIVTPANHGQEAVDIVKSGAEICAVLMDSEMPVLDGPSATKAIRKFEVSEKNDRVLIVGVSANVRAEQKEAMIASGMDETIGKPFKVDDLVRRVKSLLSSE